MVSVLSMRASNGALSHPNCQSSVLSSREFGTLSLPTLLTNLFCGWGYCQRAFLDSPAVMVCATDVHDLSRLFAEPSLVPQRKYFSMGAFTVSPMAAIMLADCQTPNARYACNPPRLAIPRRARPRAHHAQRRHLRATGLCPRLPPIVSPTSCSPFIY